MKTMINFIKPRNEATVKLYTDVSKNVWASSPNIFTQELRSGSSLPDISGNIFDTVYFTLPTVMLKSIN
ncbi:MAG TPA: hypothetical protein VN722_13160 [Hanamia sp.]|nr:hypothetical protein [Hanamia sp.]